MAERRERAIEVKVGVLVTISLAVLVGFVIILSDFGISKGVVLYVDFDNASDLKPGAFVKVAGSNAGRVERIEYWGGKRDPDVARVDKSVWIRVVITLDRDKLDTVHTDAVGYIATMGVLGEKYIELEPGSRSRPLVKSGAKLAGRSAPRFEKMVLDMRDVLDSLGQSVRKDPQIMHKILQNVNALLEEGRAVIKENRPRVSRIITKVEKVLARAEETTQKLDEAVDKANSLLAQAHKQLEANGDIRVALANVRAITTTLRADVGPIATKLKSMLDRGDRILSAFDGVAGEVKQEARQLLSHVFGILTDVKQITGNLKDGQGFAGAILTDQEMYDDLKEMIKDLKRHPWKIVWKE